MGNIGRDMEVLRKELKEISENKCTVTEMWGSSVDSAWPMDESATFLIVTGPKDFQNGNAKYKQENSTEKGKKNTTEHPET